MSLNPEILTFDCYGTLIDWEAGIRGAFRSLLAKSPVPVRTDERGFFELYEEEEKRVEKEEYRPYREVLAETARRVARRTGWELSALDAGFLATDLPRWEPFLETNSALKRLSSRCKLGILSNIDEDLLAGTLKHLIVPFDLIVTAERVRSYKPGRAHFEQARKILAGAAWVHVACSWYHDIEPALGLGIPVVWVNRGRVPVPAVVSGKSFGIVGSLTELAERFGC